MLGYLCQPVLIAHSGLRFSLCQPDIKELFLESIGQTQLRIVIQPRFDNHLLHRLRSRLRINIILRSPLSCRRVVYCQILFERLTQRFHRLVSHALDMEAVNDDAGFRE